MLSSRSLTLSPFQLTVLNDTAASLTDDSGSQKALFPRGTDIKFEKVSNTVTAVGATSIGDGVDIAALKQWIMEL